MKPNLSIKIGKLRLENPVMVASGTFGDEYADLVRIGFLGAFVTKTITLKPRIGNPPPRLAETPSGMLNSIGLENKGVEYFIKDKLPKLRRFKAPLIASIAGDGENEFKELAKILTRTKGIEALELNLSCPNIRYGNKGHLIAQDEKATHDIVKAVRGVTGLTIIAKLSPNVTDIVKIAKSAEAAGADSVSLVNTFLGIAVDIGTKRPKLGNVTGGLSGPAIKPIALRMVWEAYKAVKIPVIGMGGIMNAEDAIEFMLCGASAVQVGTANFVDPSAASKIVRGIKEYMAKHKISKISNLIGGIKI